MKTNVRSWGIKFFLAVIGAASSVGVSHAQTAGTPPSSAPLSGFAPPADDPALGALGNLFGNVGGMNFMPGVPDGPIGQMFLVFNTAVISVAALFFLWNVLSATIQGAHDGEFLGRRYHSYWMPLRTFVGVFMLMPMFAGWSAAQVFMAWAAWAGTGIANEVTTATRDVVMEETRQWAAMPERPDFMQITRDLYALTDRLIEHKQEHRIMRRDGLDESTAPVLRLELGARVIEGADNVRVVAGATNLGDGEQFEGYTNQNIGIVTIVTSSATPEYEQSRILQETHKRAVTRAVSAMMVALNADAARLGSLVLESDEYFEARAAYMGRMQAAAFMATGEYLREMEAARAEAASRSAQKTRGDEFANEWGWIGAGLGIIDGTAMSMESAGTGTSSAFRRGDAPATNVNAQIDGPGFGERYRVHQEDSFRYVSQQFETAGEAWSDGRWFASTARYVDGVMALLMSPAEAAIKSSVGLEKGGKADGKELEQILEPFNQGMRAATNELGIAVLGMMQVSSNPIAAMQHLGVDVLKVIVAVFATFVAIAAAALAASALFGVQIGGVLGGIVSGLAVLVIPIVIGLGFFGIKLAGILPFMPVIMWVGAVISYFVIVIESMFGAPLWALVHLDPDGEGMGQRTTHGYIFLLNLLFRPAIMVICLALAYKLIAIAGGLGIGALSGVLLKLVASGGDSWILPLALTLGALWVFVSLMETLIHTSFSIVNLVPSQVFTWIGGTFGSNVGTDLDRSVESGAKGMASAVGHSTSSAALHGGTQAGSAVQGVGKFSDAVRDRPTPVVNSETGRQVVDPATGAGLRARPSEVRAVHDKMRADALVQNITGGGGGHAPTSGPNPGSPSGPSAPSGSGNSITGSTGSGSGGWVPQGRGSSKS